ncbi:MAG TPA: cupin domain-containing protein [Gammaproteobacteria bacterium]|nr:cupin domain-containing protein [Gammaproteobacteria bacterium]
MNVRDLIIRASEIDAMAGEKRIHFLNPNARRTTKSLGDAVGLNNIGVHLVCTEPGRDTTEYHRHHYEEECIYVLAGEGTLVVEGDAFPFKTGDFVGFPADTAAHSLKNTGTEPLVCLVMGQRLEQDVADYPQRGKRLYRNSGRWDLVDVENIVDPRTAVGAAPDRSRS